MTVVRESYLTLLHGSDLRTVDNPLLECLKIFRQDLNVSLFEWSEDSKFIVFQAAEKVNTDIEYLESSIYIVKSPSGNPRKIAETPGKLSSMSLSPNTEKLIN